MHASVNDLADVLDSSTLKSPTICQSRTAPNPPQAKETFYAVNEGQNFAPTHHTAHIERVHMFYNKSEVASSLA